MHLFGQSAAPQLGVDEIRQPSKKQAWQGSERAHIEEMKRRDAVAPAEQPARDDDAENPAMARHAAAIDRHKAPKWELCPEVPKQWLIVEQDIPEAPADQHPQDDVDHQVAHRVGGNIAAPRAGKPANQQPRDPKAGQVRQPVPPDPVGNQREGLPRRRELDGKRIEPVQIRFSEEDRHDDSARWRARPL